MEDTIIIQLFFERDERAIVETKNKYENLCKKVAGNILKRQEDIEEVVSESLFALWESIPPNNPKYFKTFLCKIVKNQALKKVRYERAQKRVTEITPLDELAETLCSKDDVENEYIKQELSELINRYLSKISKEKRIIFVKRYWYQDSINHIADDLGISESKVKSILYRERIDLRKFLEREGVSL